MEYVTDTHSLVWYLTGDKKLSSKAKSIFSDLERGKGKLIISVVVFLEALVIIEKGRIKTTWQGFNSKVSQFPTAIIYPIGLDVLQQIDKVGKSLELHDRILATTAKIHNAIIITRDPGINKARGIKTVW